MTYNDASNDFTIEHSNDLALIGSFEVRIQSQISVPVDHSKADLKTLSSELLTMTVKVEPCTLLNYDAKPLDKLSFTIGEPDTFSDQYAFIQTPACGYAENVTIIGLPDFIEHRAESRDFAIRQTLDHALHGNYTVTIKSEIVVADDNTRESFTSWT